MRRLMHTAWVLVALLMVGSLALYYYLGWSEAGLQRLTTALSRRVGPVIMSISGARGTLARGVHLDRFTLDHQRVHIEVKDFNGRVSMLSLFLMTIHIEDAAIGDALVHVLPAAPGNQTPWTPHFLRAPLHITVQSVGIATGRLITTSGREYDASAVRGEATIRSDAIRIYSSSMQYAGLQVQADGEVLAAAPIGLRGTVRLVAVPEAQPQWIINSAIDGNLDRLAINTTIGEPIAASFTGSATALSGDWHWSGEGRLQRLDLRAWGAGNALGIVSSGTLELDGNRNGFNARGEVTAPGLGAGPLQLLFSGNYADRVLAATSIRFTHRGSGAVLEGAGTIGIVSNGPQLDLRGRWQNFRWPLSSATAPVHSQAGTYSLEGLWPFALQASGDVRIRDLPSMDFTATGHLAKDHLDAENLAVDAYGGKAALSAQARWSPAQEWQVAGTMRELNVESVRPGVRGRLDFRLQAQGQGFGAQGTLAGTFTDLGGQIRGQRASGHAKVELAGEDWLLSDVRLQLGATRLNLDGRVGGHLELKFDVDAADLALLHDQARGRLRASGDIRGDTTAPSVQLDATGSNLVWDDMTLQSLSARIALDPQASGRADTRVQLKSLMVGDRQLDSLSFSSAGTVAAHRASLEVKAPQLTLTAAGDASLDRGNWRWRIAQMRAEDGRDVMMDLEAPATLQLAANQVRLEQLCLHGTQSRVCARGSDLAGAREVTLSAESMPLRALTAGIIATTDFDGTLTVSANGSALPAQPWHGALEAQLSDAAIRHRFAGGRIESFDLGTGTFAVDMNAAGFNGTVELDAGKSGRVSGTASARGNDGDWRQWPLSGKVLLDSEALNLLDSYVPEIDRATGHINANLELGGTLGALQFDGELKVTDARLDAYQINLALRDLNFDARLHDNQLTLQGTANTGVDGKASFDGNLQWRNNLPYGKLHLAGDNLLIVNIPEAKVYAAPDVDLKMQGRRIDVTGTVELPYARLDQPDDLASAVRVSGDEMMVTSAQSERPERFEVFSNVTLKLGDRVTINTSGLQGRLSGSLTVGTDESGFTRGSGELNVEEGKYSAYGRKLDIERGRLLFSNSALGDPGIDIRATKKFPDITAGVNVRGTLSSPRMTFFSDPTVTQSQIVSLLLAGGSLEQVQSADTTNTNGRTGGAQAALVQGSAIIAQQFGARLGADVSVEQDLQNDTSLVLGRYLSPRLYVSYGLSLAEAIYTIKLNYTIGDKWTVRTEAGKERSADLVYTLQR